MNRFLYSFWGGVFILACLMPSSGSGAVIIEFDYTFDEDGFFDPDLFPERREALELAADIVNRYVDNLSAIEPTGDNTWSGSIERPDGGGFGFESVSGTIGPGVIRIYAGGKDMGGNRLASASPGTIRATGDALWRDNVFFRGQSGARANPATDNSPWGGSISFNTNDSKPWYFGKSTAGLESTKIDFLTIAMHELFHLLGFGSSQADSFEALAETGNFTGPLALADAAANSNNKTLALDSGNGHWTTGTTGIVATKTQKSIMVSSFTRGKRLYPVSLDFAAMEDIGWDPALPGDVNRDRKFDPTDITQILAANSFSQGEGFGWSAGDNDGDGDVDAFDIINILTNGLGFPGSYASLDEEVIDGPVEVVFNTLSGNVTIDTNGLDLTSLIIESAAGIFSGLAGPQWDLLGPFSADSDNMISNALFSGSFQGIDDLGDSILGSLDPGFDLLQDITVTYLAAGSTETALGSVIGVPEPSSSVLLTLGSMLLLYGLLRRRRLG